MALTTHVFWPPDALIAALRLDIEDDSAWQVLADWLCERGDPRGELIVAERRLERDGSDDPELLARVRALRQAWSNRWREGLSPPPQTRLFGRHGFVVGVRLRPWDTQRQAFLRRLLDHPVGALVQSVEVHHSGLDDEGVSVLAREPRLASLRSLTLCGGRLTVRSVQAIGSSSGLAYLASLDLGHGGLGPDAARVLADAPLALRELVLDGNAIGDEGLVALMGGAFAANLRRLDVTRNGIGARGVQRALELGNPRALRTLGLADNPIGDRGVHWLAQAGLDLLELDLGRAALTAEAGAILARARSLTRIETLRLSGNELGPHGARALLASANLGHARIIDLSDNAIGDVGALAVAASRQLGALRRLDLSHNDIRAKGAIGLAHAYSLHGLEQMRLRGNEIGASGLDALRSSAVTRNCQLHR